VPVFLSHICDDFVSDENFSLARLSTRTFFLETETSSNAISNTAMLTSKYEI
jgi:hypothetical protein